MIKFGFKKAVLALMLGALPLLAEQVEVTADEFYADEGKQISEFKGNVKYQKRQRYAHGKFSGNIF